MPQLRGNEPILGLNTFSREVAMRGLQDRDVYNQRGYQVDPIQEQYNIYISLPTHIYSSQLSIISNTVML